LATQNKKRSDGKAGPENRKGGSNVAKVKNVEKRIWDLEGFAVRILHLGGRDVRGDRSGLPQYPYLGPAGDEMTVESWKEERFRRAYPGFDVDVLDAYGDSMHGNAYLRTVRETYLEDYEA
jgi:hypothetical protein